MTDLSPAKGYKVTRLVLSNYGGVEARSYDFPEGGALLKGRNGDGKTTALRGLRAALVGAGVSAEAIKNGSDEANIFVDLQSIADARRARVHRKITKSGSTLSVKVEGDKRQVESPARWLAEALGDCAIDPLDLITKKKAERRAIVLSAMPIAVTEQRVRGWAPGLPAGFSFDGHGLDVVRRAHEFFYEARRIANQKAKDAAAAAELLHKDTKEVPVSLSVEDAAASVAATTQALANLQARRNAFVAATERTQRTREQIASIEAEASALEKSVAECPVTESDFENAEAVVAQATELVARIEAQLAEARGTLGAANLNRTTIADQLLTAINAGDRAKELRASAGKLSAAIEQTSPDVSEDEISQAKADREAADREVALAAEADAARKAIAKATEAKALAVQLQAKAGELDVTVRTLADVAPVELLAEAQGVDGISLVGDDVAWNGVLLGDLCGAEQVRICVDIARRLNATSKIIVCDGLERLDPEQLDVFLPWAIRDGYQLIASMVARGDVQTVHIEATQEAA